MRKINNSKCHINYIQKSLLMSIVDIPEKNVSKIDRKLEKRKLRTSSIKSLSTLFPCLIREMYNRVHCDQNQRLMLNSYTPAINKSIFPMKHYKIFFLKNLSMNYMTGLEINLM